MNLSRANILINNLLVQMSEYGEMDQETFMNWLRLEVGFTDEELKELKEANCLPTIPA